MSVLGFEPRYGPGQSYPPQLGLLLLCLVPASVLYSTPPPAASRKGCGY